MKPEPLTHSGLIPRPHATPPAVALPPSSSGERLARLARMIGALRLIDGDLRAMSAEQSSAEAHPLRLGRAHALALIDLLGDLAEQLD